MQLRDDGVAVAADPEGTDKAEFLAIMEWVYLGIFTLELLTKVLAYGVFATAPT